jgi:hypothetical protein
MGPVGYGLRGVIAALLAAAAFAQEEPQLTPREMFYAPPPVPAAAQTPAAQKPAARPAQAKPAHRAEAPHAAASPVVPRTDEANVSYVPAAAVAYGSLGLRYSVVKVADGQEQEVDPDGVFRGGDRIRLAVEVNEKGYLYIVSRGSSGSWSVLFPSAQVDGGSNVVERGRRYALPPGNQAITFVGQAGVEKLFVVLSRQPVADLEKLIYSLAQGKTAPEPAKDEKVLLAQNLRPIDDDLIGRLRAASRDLMVEKVDAETAGPKKEYAVYAVNASGAPDARVVADVSLNHR